MKKRFLAVFMVLMLSSTVAGAEVIKTLNLDNPNKLGLTIEKDAKATVEGKNPIRIHTLWPTTICLGEFGGVDVQNATLICKVAVKSQLEGRAYLEMWVQINGERYFSKGISYAVSGESNWKIIQAPFRLEAGQAPEKVTINLQIEGTGTVWISDVMLDKEPLSY